MKTLLAIMISLVVAPAALAQSSAARDDAQQLRITRNGAQPSSNGSAENFTGKVRVDPLFAATDSYRTSGAYVTFEAGARSAWHTHPAGQLLIVTAGVGRVQRWDGPIEEIRPGDAVWIPPGVKHWHGASTQSSMTHLAIQEQRDGKTVDWLEKVSDATGDVRSSAPNDMPRTKQPSVAQRMYGDFAPKLAELTDDVLYGDVWARPGLSPRDRSLVTVSALIAMNRPDQLRSHFALASQNGVTQDELIETIIHLAFYAGWPSAVTAVTVAKEVFPKR